VKLGKLLKAGLLSMVRPVKDAKEPALEVVISETAGGLRMLIRVIPLTKSAEEDVAAMLAAVRTGIKKHGESITEVIAVPPFVSNDLEFSREYLKGAYAKLAESEALDRKGVVVVELAEAEALAKEIALAASGAKLVRPLPAYLFGEYRHEVTDKTLTVTLKLRTERGGKMPAKAESITVKPAESSATVRKWSAGVLDALAKDTEPRPPADAKAEARALADRSGRGSFVAWATGRKRWPSPKRVSSSTPISPISAPMPTRHCFQPSERRSRERGCARKRINRSASRRSTAGRSRTSNSSSSAGGHREAPLRRRRRTVHVFSARRTRSDDRRFAARTPQSRNPETPRRAPAGLPPDHSDLRQKRRRAEGIRPR